MARPRKHPATSEAEIRALAAYKLRKAPEAKS